MIELIIGGALTLVGGLFQHLYQRMRNKDERKARWEGIVNEKRLEALEEAVRTLASINDLWVDVCISMYNAGDKDSRLDYLRTQRAICVLALTAHYQQLRCSLKASYGC